MKSSSVLPLARGAVCAALYVLLTFLSFGLAGGAVQCRLAEALCVLPAFFPEAVPGLFIGCLLSNLLTGGGVIDVIFGALATLLAAVITRVIRGIKPALLLPLPTVLLNAAIVPFGILYLAGTPVSAASYFPVALTVFIGEAISAGVLGTILYGVLSNRRIFNKES